MMKPRDVTIKTKLGGWLARIGCTEVVFTNKKEMLQALDSYLSNPKETEANYMKNAVNHEFYPDDGLELAQPEEVQNEP